MTNSPGVRTSATLLARLRHTPPNQEAWAEFVDRYGPVIYRWCRHWQLQDADARDTSQAVLVTLCVKMRSFRYDASRSFRGWLRTLTLHTMSDLAASRKPAVQGFGSSEDSDHDANWLERLEAREDLIERIDSQFDLELFEEAAARVRLRVEPHTWEAFRLTAIELMSGTAVAGLLGMKVATVFKAKSKVQYMLREEIGRLEGSEQGDS